MKASKEFELNKRPDRPTNRAIISLFSPARIYDFLHFGIAYVEYDDEDGKHILQKHIMRYPQFFASKAIQRTLSLATVVISAFKRSISCLRAAIDCSCSIFA